MVKQAIWVGITVAVFFAGIGVSYAVFSNTYDPGTMKFQNQQLFDQMMSQNPRMSSQWIGSMMQDQEFMQGMMSQGIIPEKEPVISHPEKMTSAAPLPDTAKGPQIDYSKGYFVEEIRDGLYWVFCYGICLEQEPKNILRIKCS